MEKEIELIRQYHMIQKGDHVIAGVSGGPDSVYLLFLLLEYQKQVNFSICVVHVEHGIRGEESRQDAEFVRKLCEGKKVPFYLAAVNAEEEAKEKKISVEEAGRILRYEAFEKIRKKYGGKIAVAHNEDDQAETILWNLARGSGLSGLCGMHLVRGKIIRPLLFTSRAKIEEWLTHNGIAWRQDGTNLEQIYTRNKIRLNILPQMRRQMNTQVSKHIAEAGKKIQKAELFLRKTAEAVKKRYVFDMGEAIKISAELQTEEEIIQEYVIRNALNDVSYSLKNVTQKHIEALKGILQGADGRQTDLPGGITGKKERGFLILSQNQRIKNEKVIEEKNIWMEIMVPCCIKVKNKKVECMLEETKSQRIPEKSYTKWIDYDTIRDKLVLRNRLSGDYLVVNESGGKKKLKDYFIDQKIPKQDRDSVLLLADGSHILWVIGYRISEACKVKESTKNILKIKITEENEDGTQDQRIIK